MTSIGARLEKIEERARDREQVNPSLEWNRKVQIARCRMLIGIAENDGNIERVTELKKHIEEIEAGLHDPDLSAPPLTNDERARRTREMMLRELRDVSPLETLIPEVNK